MSETHYFKVNKTHYLKVNETETTIWSLYPLTMKSFQRKHKYAGEILRVINKEILEVTCFVQSLKMKRILGKQMIK